MSVQSPSHSFWRSLGSLFLISALVACGGGSDAPAVPAPSPVVVVPVTLPVAVPAVPAAPSNPTTELTTTGRLNYLVYRVNTGATAIETATVSASVTNALSGGAGTLTLAVSPTPLVVTTTDTWASFIWSAPYKGILSLSGNVGLACDVVSSTKTGQVGVSHNMLPVTDLDELKGLTFGGYDCSTTVPTGTYAFNFLADGSLDADGDILPADDVAALFKQSGLDIDSQNLKLRAYKIEQGGQLRYAMVLQFVETNPTTGAQTFGVELLLN